MLEDREVEGSGRAGGARGGGGGAGNPVRDLAKDLGRNLSERAHSDRVMGSDHRIDASGFEEIRDVKEHRRIAFVDGGEGPLDESPSFLVTVNRVYFSIFRGRERIRPRGKARVEFFSYVSSSAAGEGGRAHVRYDTRLFTRHPEDRKYLPDEADLGARLDRSAVLQGAKMNSMAMKFAEWKTALVVVRDELERGDVLVRDGALQTGFKNEAEYAKRLYAAAIEKGVIVCGLAKTSRLITEAGEPLLARVEEIAEKVDHGRWYVKLAEGATEDDRGVKMAIKLHRNSGYVFRFEILKDQYECMGAGEVNSILASLAENAHDIRMPGYPYGLIDADTFAQVRIDEIPMYRGMLRSEQMRWPEWKRLRRYSKSLAMHDALNGVTG